MDVENSIDALRKKYLRMRLDTEAQLASIRQKLAVLDELKAEASQSESGAGLTAAEVTSQFFKGIPPRKIPDDAGLTDAILLAAKAFFGKPFTPPQLRDCLLANGYKPINIENFAIAIGTTLSRLVASDRLVSEKD